MSAYPVFKTLMNELSNAFERKARDNQTTFVALKDDAPAWIHDCNLLYRMHEALDGRMPDDWVYEAVYELSCNYNVCDDAYACREQEFEVCDGLVSIYTVDLTAWLASHLGNVTLCDDAKAEGLTLEPDITAWIRAGQFIAYQRISAALIECIEESESRLESEAAS